MKLKKFNTYKIFAMMLLTSSTLFYACNQEGMENLLNETVNLKFETINTSDKSTHSSSINIIIETGIEYIDGFPKLTSNKLVEIPVTNYVTNETTYAYVLKSDYDQMRSSKNNIRAGSGSCDPGIEYGYGFTGTCFQYGTFYIGDNCNTIFVTCGLSCIGFDDVCPGWGEEFA